MKEIEMMKLRCCGPAPENTGILKQNNIPPAATSINRYADHPLYAKGPYLCSGSQCAAWVENRLYRDPETNRLFTSNVGGEYIEEVNGFCGLISFE